MSVFTSFAGGKISAEIVELSSYENLTVSVNLAATEVEIVIPTDAVYIRIYNRTDSLTKVAFASGESGSNYMTLVPGNSETWRKKAGTAMSLYVQCIKGSQTIEMVYGYL